MMEAALWGIVMGEMKIQQDIVITLKGGRSTLVGWVDLGEENMDLRAVHANGSPARTCH